MVTVFAAVGVSGSGKTTTLEYLISKLTKEGYRVGAIKHIHRENFTIDKEGTNTWRFSKAGAQVTVAISAQEIAIIKKTDNGLNSLSEIIDMFEKEKIDVAFIEGLRSAISKKSYIAKIVTAKDVEGLNKTLDETVEPILAITGLIAKNKSGHKEHGVPFFDLPEEGEKLADAVIKYLNEEKNRKF